MDINGSNLNLGQIQIQSRGDGLRAPAQAQNQATRVSHDSYTPDPGDSGPVNSRQMTTVCQSPEQQIRNATSPNILDNQDAAGVRTGYRQAARKSSRTVSRPSSRHSSMDQASTPWPTGTQWTSRSLPGEHDGDPPGPDGSSSKVTYSPNDPGSTTVDKKNFDGSSDHYDQNGTDIRHTHDANRSQAALTGDQNLDESFSLDKQGRPVRETETSGGTFGERTVTSAFTTANPTAAPM